MRIVVVGGGIAGLAAARRLELRAPDADVVLVERDQVLGGKIRTEHVDGFVVEAAPDSFLTRKERGVGLCEELGLSGELIARRPEHHGSFVRHGDHLHPLPEGLTGMIPTSLEALEASELLSAEAKARFAAEPDVPPASDASDESIGSFVSRRFGREAYEALVEPLLTGIYGGDGDLLSLRATFPQLRAIEIEHGIAGDALRIVERWRRPDARVFEYSLVVEDPKMLTAPWTGSTTRRGIVPYDTVLERPHALAFRLLSTKRSHWRSRMISDCCFAARPIRFSSPIARPA